MCQLTNGQGQVTLANAYEPYGVLAQTAGSAQTSYGFTGEQTDPSGMVYLRARYYSPNDGRFLTQDPFDGNPAYPASLNPYTYGYNNPVRYTDPNGDCVEPATFFLVCLPVIMGLAAAAADVYYQVHVQHNGNWDCVDWGEVAMYGGGVAAAVLVIGVSGYALTAIPDWAIDLASLTHNLSAGNYSAARWDVASLALPGVTGLGALSHADEAYDALRYSDNVADSVSDFCRVNSFSADTDVATSDGDKPISQIQIGDYVLALDEETNSISFYPVTDTIHHTDEVIVHLTIDGEEIETTPEHPFYVEGTGWTDAEDLQLGDDIRNADGETGEVESIEFEQTSQEMYNLTVDEAHTFFVGDGQWLVHNCPPDIQPTVETSTLFRFANDPLYLTSPISRLPDIFVSNQKYNYSRMTPNLLQFFAEAHATGGLGQLSPFISTISDLKVVPAVTDPKFRNIIDKSNFLFSLSVPKNILYYPSNPLSLAETEVLIFSEDALSFITKVEFNPFKK